MSALAFSLRLALLGQIPAVLLLAALAFSAQRAWWSFALMAAAAVGIGAAAMLSAIGIRRYLVRAVRSRRRCHLPEWRGREKRLEAVLDAVHTAVVVTDARHVVRFFNGNARTTFAYSPARVLGTSAEALFTPTGWKHYLDAVEVSIHPAPAESPRSVMCRCVRRGGKAFTAEIAVASIREADGSWIHAAVVVDITERMDVHRSLRDASQVSQEASLHFERMLLSDMDRRMAAIARELHDSAGSTLAGIDLLLQSARRGAGWSDLGLLLGKCQEQVLSVSARLRDITAGIMPAGSEAGALEAALEQYALELERLHGMRCTLRTRGNFCEIDAVTAAHVYRIAQEAAGNAVRHGRASRIELRLARADALCSLLIRDNGGGCDLATVPHGHPGLGIKSMRARARALEGSLELRGGLKGCDVYLRWPASGSAGCPRTIH